MDSRTAPRRSRTRAPIAVGSTPRAPTGSSGCTSTTTPWTTGRPVAERSPSCSIGHTAPVYWPRQSTSSSWPQATEGCPDRPASPIFTQESRKELRVADIPGGPVQILVVDDEEPIRNALKKFLAQQQFEVYVAGTGDEALQQLRRHRVSLMLCDIRMPGTSGVDLVPQALEVEPELAILMLTAVNDATSAALCMQRGAMDYLTKPLELADLGRAVQRALKRREMLLENRQLNQWLKEEVTTRTAEVQRERMKLERLSIATLEALVNALEAKDPYMRGHSARVADMSATVAHQLGLSEEEVEHVRVAGRLHDIGKIGTREAVLNKQGALTPEEFEHVKQHVVIGSQILAPLSHLGDIMPAVRYHHERWDGTGYPDGLRGEEIPLAARIIGAAEVFDALSTSRAYQEKMTPEKAVERIADLAGTVLDPKVYEALTTVVARRKTLVFLDEGGTTSS